MEVTCAAVIPYFYLPTFHIPVPGLGSIPIQPFGILVGIGLIVGYLLAVRRARLVGLDPDVCADAIVWAVVGGFVGGHLVSVLFYYPERIAERPIILLEVWAGLSSFGGWIGGTTSAVLFLRRKGERVLPYIDAIMFGTVPGWAIGRAGCAVVHDHPGLPTSMPFGILFPDGVVRHDLGFYGMIFLIVLTVVLYNLRPKRTFPGLYTGFVMLCYAPVRFAFDFLRTQDRTYLGLTPGQFIAVGGFGLGMWLIYRGRTSQAEPTTGKAS